MKRAGLYHIGNASKRVCYGDNPPTNASYDNLVWSCLPDEIRDGLPHVVELIKVFVMSPLEAMVEAARTGQTEWLRKLLERSNCHPTPEAAIAAGENNDLEALKLLYSFNMGYFDCEATTWKILDAAAAKGFLDVVEYSCQLLRYRYHAPTQTTALSSAISNGHLEVVRMLLNPNKFRWNIGRATELAISEKQLAIVELIHQNFVEISATIPSYGVSANDTLIVHLVRGGAENAVVYLYEHGFWDADSTNKTFEVAAERGLMVTVLYLSDTGVISSQAYDLAMIAAAKSERVEVVTFLHTNDFASSGALNTAITTTKNLDIAKYLFDTGSITDDSLRQLFKAESQINYNTGKRVAILKMLVTERVMPDLVIAVAKEEAIACGDADLVMILYQSGRFSNEEIVLAFTIAVDKDFNAVVKLLVGAECITDETIAESFMKSAGAGNVDIARTLLDQERVTSEVITDAFLLAAKRNRSAVTKELFCKQKAAPKEICDLFERAARSGHFPIARTLMDSPHVTEEMKDKALITVAERGKSGARKFMGRRYSCRWSQEALKKALAVAKDGNVVSALRDRIYNLDP